MLFPARLWDGVRDGAVTVAFRRWRRPTVKASATLQSPAGLLAIDEVTVIDETDVTDEGARAAGYHDREEVVADLRPEGTLTASGSTAWATTPGSPCAGGTSSTTRSWPSCARPSTGWTGPGPPCGSSPTALRW